jgi:hypothetical protein
MSHETKQIYGGDFQRLFWVYASVLFLMLMLSACQSAVPKQSMTGVPESEFDGGRYLRTIKGGVTLAQADAASDAACQELRGHLPSNALAITGCSSRSAAHQLAWASLVRDLNLGAELRMHYRSEALCSTAMNAMRGGRASNVAIGACQKK